MASLLLLSLLAVVLLSFGHGGDALHLPDPPESSRSAKELSDWQQSEWPNSWGYNGTGGIDVKSGGLASHGGEGGVDSDAVDNAHTSKGVDVGELADAAPDQRGDDNDDEFDENGNYIAAGLPLGDFIEGATEEAVDTDTYDYGDNSWTSSLHHTGASAA